MYFVYCHFQSSSRDGLVSILKRRRASLDGLPPPSSSDAKPSCKRKVRFSEPEDAIDQGICKVLPHSQLFLYIQSIPFKH